MKVLHVIPSVAAVRGGPSEAVLAMVKALRAQNLNVEIATTNDCGADLLEVPLGQLLNYQGVPIRFFGRFSPNNVAIREFAWSEGLTSWLWQQAQQYDLLHVHAIFSYPSTAAMAIARWQNIPYIVRPIGQLNQWSLEQSRRKKQIYLNVIEKANLAGSLSIHVTSQQEQEELQHLKINTPSFILPHGIDIPPLLPNARQELRQKMGVPENEPIILFMSRLHPKKGLDYLIPALGHLQQHRFTLALVGSGTPEYEREIDRLLISAGISDRTYRPGFVRDSASKNLLLQGSDLFALTSHSENFGLAVLEAMAAGLPVAITPGVALSEFAQKHDLGWVTKLDIPAIASAIADCWQNPQAAKTKGDRARSLVLEQYNWDCIALELIAIYQSLLSQKRSLS